jgi:aminotransferase
MAHGPRVSERVSAIGKSAIHEMTRLSKDIDDVAFLSWAKPAWATPEHINEGAIKAIKDGLVSGYSEDVGILPLREEIVAKLARDNHIEADPSEIIVTVGAIEGLAAAIMATVDPGDEVILPSPTYATHIQQVRMASGKPVFVPLKEEEGFGLDLDGLREAVTPKTKAFLFCSPNNPAGNVFSEDELRGLGEFCLEHGITIITDEAYEYFVYDGNRHFSAASVPELRPNVVSCFTFTKTYAMTGWRLGYIHASQELVPEIKKTHIPFVICPPVVSQYAALAALKGPQDCVAEFREHYLAARNLMCERLDGLGRAFSYHRPEGSYLMFPRILAAGGEDSTTFCKRLLQEARVSTTPGAAFGPTGERHLRLSFCVPESEINKAFDRLETYLS